MCAGGRFINAGVWLINAGGLKNVSLVGNSSTLAGKRWVLVGGY